MAPRLMTGIVPSPSPNLTPERTSGIDPGTDTSVSIHCLLARGKLSGVRAVVVQLPVCASHCHSAPVQMDVIETYKGMLVPRV